jgi:hypothetical protein
MAIVSENVNVQDKTIESVDDLTTAANVKTNKIDINVESVVDEQTSMPVEVVRMTDSSDNNNIRSEASTPIYSQIQKPKESVQTEDIYSTVKSSVNIDQKHEPSPGRSSTNYGIAEIVQTGIAEPPVTTSKSMKSSKKSPSIDGLLKIINDHQERAQIYQASDKPTDSVSYFRVAKSRHGKFETDSRGFVNNAVGVFDANEKASQHERILSTSKPSENVTHAIQPSKSNTTVTVHNQSKGKQAYDLLKKYEKDDADEQRTSPLTIDTDYLKNPTPSIVVEKNPSPTPIQVSRTFIARYCSFDTYVFTFVVLSVRSHRTDDAYIGNCFSKYVSSFSCVHLISSFRSLSKAIVNN